MVAEGVAVRGRLATPAVPDAPTLPELDEGCGCRSDGWGAPRGATTDGLVCRPPPPQRLAEWGGGRRTACPAAPPSP